MKCVKKRGNGEVPQYYVENAHPAIVEPEVYDLVQAEIEKRSTRNGRAQSGLSSFSSRIICGECGGFFGPKTWHSNSKYKRTIWRCNHKYKNGENCQTPHLNEEQVRKVFVNSFNQLYDNRKQLLEDYSVILRILTDTSTLDKSAQTELDQNDYQRRYDTLAARYETAKARCTRYLYSNTHPREDVESGAYSSTKWCKNGSIMRSGVDVG